MNIRTFYVGLVVFTKSQEASLFCFILFNGCLVAETCNMEHIRWHYYGSHKQINPNGIVPMYNGPNLSEPVEN